MSYDRLMTTLSRAPFFLVAGLLLASACPGGTESRVCNEYFQAAEQCAAKAQPQKADMLRSVVKLAQEGLARNNDNKRAVEATCEKMHEELRKDPECK